MDAPANSNRCVRAGLFEIDLSSGEIHKNGRKVPLQEQPFRVLAMLLEHPGEIVTREELQARLWPADMYVGFDDGLNTAIRKLRVAFGDSAENPCFIETVPRRGYRVIAPVKETNGDFGESSQGQRGAGIESTVAAVLRARHLRTAWRAGLVLAVTLIAVFGGVVHLLRSRLPASVPRRRVMLAILPFENLSNDPAQEYFSDGLTEETITELGQLSPQDLGVIARTSAMTYKRTDKTVSQIGRELDVDYILEGSVRREGGKARVSAQLIRVSDQTHVWAQSYDRELHELIEIEDELGKSIAQQVRVNLGPQRQIPLSKTHPSNPEAYDLYLKGRYYWNQRTQDSLWRGIQSFKESIEKDPSYANAYVGLADCYILLGPNDVLPARQVYPLAKSAALKALELDDALAGAHASLGFVMLLYEWNPAQAENEFRRAVELDPNNPTAHHWYAYDLAAMNRSSEAVAEIRRALKLDPLSPIINADECQILYLARRPDEAVAQCKNAIELDPGFTQTYWYLGVLYEQKGRFDDAIGAFLKAPPVPSGAQDELAMRAAYRVSGIKGYWHERLALLLRQSRTHYVSPYTLAVSYSLLGDRNRAMENLEKAFDERHPSMVFVSIEPVFDSLHSDQRFASLRQKLGSITTSPAPLASR
jgi:TolB-like protein/DNA-binding winged helix-turn-helix (wHTH) protein